MNRETRRREHLALESAILILKRLSPSKVVKAVIYLRALEGPTRTPSPYDAGTKRGRT